MLPEDRVPGRVYPNGQDPVMCAVLSGCCLPGLGQVIAGQYAKGIAFFLGSLVLAIVTAGFSVTVTWPVIAIDAYLVAAKLQRGKSVGQWEMF